MKKISIFILIIPVGFLIGQDIRDIRKIAEEIKGGKIDVGKEAGMELDQRWHNIHVNELNMDCEKCHIDRYEENYLYQRKHKVPERDAPGVVKREICLPCHKKGGPALTELYGK